MKITIQTVVPVPVEKAWKYYTQAEHIKQWNFASEEWCCPSVENDLRVGGKYLARMEAKDKSFGFDFGGTYYEVITGEKLGYVLDDGRKVNVTFENMRGETKVTITFDAESENSEELQRNGWQSILDNYKKHVEQIG